MDFQKTIISIIAVLALFAGGLVSARMLNYREFQWLGEVEPRQNGGVQFSSLGNDEGGGVSITNDISVSAGTGGNSASGGNGQAGGTVQTGSAKAEVKVRTEINGEVVEEINEKYEGEADIEKEFENASGTVKTKIRVEVDGNQQPTTSNRRQEPREEKRKASWFPRIWPFGGDGDESSESNTTVGTSSFNMKVSATSTTTTTNNLSDGRNIKEAIRSFFKNLFSIFRF